MTAQANQALPETNRRVRTSAAMIGLAVSMGAYGVTIPHQGDQALAADSPTSESAPSNVSTSFETAKAISNVDSHLSPDSSQAESVPSKIEHTVQEGQTLWDVARFYDTDASAIAAANGLSLDSVLFVGQILIVPTDVRVAQASASPGLSTITPSYYGPVSGRSSESQLVAAQPKPSLDEDLKSKQDKAVETLKDKRETLRSSLTALRSTSQQTALLPNENSTDKAVETPAPVPSVLPSNENTKVSQFPSSLPETSTSTAETKQEIALRGPAQFSQPMQPSVGANSYRVSPGDSLAKIARSYGVSVKQLVEANNISDPNYIFVNQVLQIPGGQNSVASSREFSTEVAVVPTGRSADVSTGTLPSNKPFTVVPQEEAGNSAIAAKAPFVVNPQQSEAIDSSSNLLRYNHVKSLKNEIEQLRDKYNQKAPSTQAIALATPSIAAPSAKAVVNTNSSASVAEPINPEFNPTGYSRLSTIRERLRSKSSTTVESTVTSTSASPQPQVVAAAPLGSANYDPIQSRLGETVSPDLPPLGSGSEYLPGTVSEGYIWPTRGVLTSPYGWRWGRMHKGIDIAGPVGTPVVAAASGRVTYAGWNSGGYGYLVEIEHPDGSLTLYAHNSRILVQVGQEVAQGQQVSEMGSTGYSTGPHLHFEVHPAGKGAVNPMAFLSRG